MTQKPAFGPHTLFQRAIYCLDPEGVDAAINLGADVNEAISSYETALENCLTKHSYLYKKDGESNPDREKEAKAIKMIVTRILQERIEFQHTQYGDPLDSIVSNISARAKDLAEETVITVLAQQVENKKAPYTINFQRIFEGIGGSEPKEDRTTIRQDTMNAIERLHNRVYELIQEGKSINAAYLKKNMDKIGPWAAPFIRPDMDKLPRPSKEFIDAVKGAGKSLGPCVSILKDRHLLKREKISSLKFVTTFKKPIERGKKCRALRQKNLLKKKALK
jgi:hypothetical protein